MMPTLRLQHFWLCKTKLEEAEGRTHWFVKNSLQNYCRKKHCRGYSVSMPLRMLQATTSLIPEMMLLSWICLARQLLQHSSAKYIALNLEVVHERHGVWNHRLSCRNVQCTGERTETLLITLLSVASCTYNQTQWWKFVRVLLTGKQMQCETKTLASTDQCHFKRTQWHHESLWCTWMKMCVCCKRYLSGSLCICFTYF